MTLRDIVGCSSREACVAFGLAGTDERVLLDRGRTRVRVEAEEQLGAMEPTV
jgi:hypothetical protein